MATSETACTYASMILHDDGIPITAEKIATLLEAANVTVESYWPGLFARLAASKDLGELILNAGSGCAPAAAAAAPVADAAAAAAPAAEEKKKEEPEEDSDEDMGISLFD